MAQRPDAPGLGRGESFGLPLANPAHWARSGQATQGGVLGPADGGAEVHHRLDEIARTIGRGHRQHQLADLARGRIGQRVERAITRLTLVSTTAAFSPNAIAAIAAAV